MANANRMEPSSYPRKYGNDSRDKRPGICWFYQRNTTCKFGDQCKYRHDQPTPTRTQRKPFTPQSMCKFFQSNGQCRFGSNCRFSHVFPQPKIEVLPPPVPDKPLCRYFLAGHCFKGELCPYSHAGLQPITPDVLLFQNPPAELATEFDRNEPPQESSIKKPTLSHKTYMPNTDTSLSDATDDVLSGLRTTEIEQFRKRFPSAEFLDMESLDVVCLFTFQPTDPDWPYDVKDVPLIVTFPENYPKRRLCIAVGESELLPASVKREIEMKTREWLRSKQRSLADMNKVQLMFRPFLKWLDKNIEAFFTTGLRKYQKELMAEAAGVEFVTASELQGMRGEDMDSDSDDELPEIYEADHDEGSAAASAIGTNEGDSAVGPDDEPANDDAETTERAGDNIDNSGDSKENIGASSIDVARRGTEVRFENFQLRESAATMEITSVALVIKCQRCKNASDLTAPAGQACIMPCVKCNSTQTVRFRPSLAHSFTSTVGYLDLDGCTVFDLLLADIKYELGCLGCSQRMKIVGLPPGIAKDTWCHNCHQKMRVAVDSVRFLQLQPSDLTIGDGSVQVIDVKKIKRVPKDPAIQEGLPLPDHGACKHFKKSFRWFRFPCCGKVYPCDICHDEKEGDHDMKLANRIICGFCCKEQIYSADNPCVACKSIMTKKTTAHWEGGKGCRDKLTMAKGDERKYANTKKTLSKKAQSKIPGQKTTKLRHISD